ncbi:hypothetical protein SGLAM104S_09175 [Streptomyces glaucescens]
MTIPSALAGICNATSPLWGMVLSLVALSEDRPTRARVAGLGLGFLGVLTVLGAWQGFHGLDATGHGDGSAGLPRLFLPDGWIYVRRTLACSSHSNLSLTGAQLLLATLQLAVVTPLFTSAPSHFPVVPLLATAALGVLGTGLAVLVQYGLVAEVGPTTGSDGHVLHPGRRDGRRCRDPRRVAELVGTGRRGDRPGGRGTYPGAAEDQVLKRHTDPLPLPIPIPIPGPDTPRWCRDGANLACRGD